MIEADDLLEFTEELIYERKRENLSDLQRTILLTSLQGNRVTYDQLAADCGYSPKYVKQDIAPKLWQMLSDVLDQKVTKANARAMLEREIRKHSSRPSISTGLTEVVEQATPPPTISPFEAVSNLQVNSGSDFLLDSEPSAHPDNILLVDDQPKNLKLLSDVLEEQGYTVQQAINGTVALQAVAIAPPDLILLDIQMPDPDGYVVCQTLKADPKTQDIPVIFVSAMDEAWDKVKAFSVGGADYISKPFKLVEVLARVEHQLKIQKLQQTLKRQNAQLQQAIQELQRLAAIDPVTQVSNRHRFDDYFQACWQSGLESKTPLSLVMCSVDGFNAFYDSHGSQVGDRYLHHIAQIIKKSAQHPNDLVCRYSGVTFAVVLPELESAQIETIAQTLLDDFRALSLSNTNQSQTPVISLSIGATTIFPDHETNCDVLVERCDLALREARVKGPNCFVIG